MESTPIQNLQQSNEGGEEDDSRIVQSILQEMNEQGQSMPEQNSAPQMQVMPQQQHQQYMQQEMPEYDPDDAYEAYEEVQEYKKETLVQTILREVREPLVVIALYVLTNSLL